MLAKAMTMGGAGLGLAQKLMTSIRVDKPAGKPSGLPVAVIPVHVSSTNGKVDPAKV